ncbi:MAG: 3'-5' exonuclease [Eubacterium sp.]|nr:3'-5' exonuclease [Eubacterium sp.]
MNYIVFDLEWNQCPYGKDREVKRLPFEIIEIGAVKLNEKREVVDTFQRIIKPTVYKTLNYRTREIVHLTKKDLDAGELFPDAVREFLAWSGHDSVFCTWGTVDLPELQRNMKYFHLLHLIKGPFHYYDVQKLFAVQYEDMKSRRSLEYGIDFLQLDKDEAFHRALADAKYTAEIFRRIDMDVVLAYDSIDVYQNPKTKVDEIHTIYNGYSKYISREFANKEEAMLDTEVVSTYCCRCGRKTRKKVRWFSVNSRNYYAVSVCPEHGLLKGKIRMKHTDEDKVYVVKTIKISNELEAEEIRRKKEELREKRRRKRHETVDNRKRAFL